ncbi:Uncharacterised protein [Enterobacter hormaechei]|nr:Uncharacterised protein [Enterobacter hormaechei]SAE77071.1 Uncharacterised protein [Enterobacter hormaechei]SAH73863.1 Uncharacterised protein [Enterobacter hormaechei]
MQYSEHLQQLLNQLCQMRPEWQPSIDLPQKRELQFPLLTPGELQ